MFTSLSVSILTILFIHLLSVCLKKHVCETIFEIQDSFQNSFTAQVPGNSWMAVPLSGQRTSVHVCLHETGI